MSPDALPDLPPLDTPGVHPLPAGGIAGLVSAAGAAGIRLHRIDLAARRDKAGLLAALAEGLSFPAWFGHNWDALSDCLADLSWLPEACVAIVFEHAERLAESAPDDYLTALEIFTEAAESLAAEGRRLILFAPRPPRRCDSPQPD
jgi:RNAse (barnase) inhibitor barstar